MSILLFLGLSLLDVIGWLAKDLALLYPFTFLPSPSPNSYFSFGGYIVHRYYGSVKLFISDPSGAL